MRAARSDLTHLNTTWAAVRSAARWQKERDDAPYPVIVYSDSVQVSLSQPELCMSAMQAHALKAGKLRSSSLQQALSRTICLHRFCKLLWSRAICAETSQSHTSIQEPKLVAVVVKQSPPPHCPNPCWDLGPPAGPTAHMLCLSHSWVSITAHEDHFALAQKLSTRCIRSHASCREEEQDRDTEEGQHFDGNPANKPSLPSPHWRQQLLCCKLQVCATAWWKVVSSQPQRDQFSIPCTSALPR